MELQPDEDGQHDARRAMFAMMLILGLMLVWGFLFRPKLPQPPEPQPAPSTAEPAPGTLTSPATAAEPATAAQPGTAVEPHTAAHPGTATHPATTTRVETATEPTPRPPEPEPDVPARTISKTTRSFTAEFTNQDGALARLTLAGSGAVDDLYFRTPQDKAQAREKRAQDPDADISEHGFPLLGQSGTLLSLVVFDAYDAETDREEDEPDTRDRSRAETFPPRRFRIVQDDERTVAFRATFLGGRLELTKTYRLPDDEAPLQRHIRLEVQLRNLDDQPLELDGYALRSAGGLGVDLGPKSWDKPAPTEADRKAAARYMAAAVGSETGAGDVNVARRSVGKLQDGDLYEDAGLVLWSAAQSNYFAAVLEPMREDGAKNWVRSGGARALSDHNLTTDIQAAAASLEPGQSIVRSYRLFAGPKIPHLLEAYGYEEVEDKSWFDPVVRLMGFILRGAHAVVPNYGVAILVLTLIVRACLHPLSRHSQVSMQRMQKLQPKFQEIREKYKSDKKRQQEELMKLQREHGFN
ncbi:MAG: YidC/Oxa1 family insertase periplasmic-domain containing protein, partial [Planctomycetota bacterium]